jgi:hypothetical protein
MSNGTVPGAMCRCCVLTAEHFTPGTGTHYREYPGEKVEADLYAVLGEVKVEREAARPLGLRQASASSRTVTMTMSCNWNFDC